MKTREQSSGRNTKYLGRAASLFDGPYAFLVPSAAKLARRPAVTSPLHPNAVVAALPHLRDLIIQLRCERRKKGVR